MKTKINILLILVLFITSCGDSNNETIDNYFFNKVVERPVPLTDGNWGNSEITINISGTEGKITGLISNQTINAKNAGILKIGDLILKNIVKKGSTTWTCQQLLFSTMQGSITSVFWDGPYLIEMLNNNKQMRISSNLDYYNYTLFDKIP